MFFHTKVKKTFVKVDGRKGENHFAVDIVLYMLGSLVMSSDRAMAAITAPGRLHHFRQWKSLTQGIDWCKSVVRSFVFLCDAKKEFKKTFHLLKVSQIVERREHEVRIPQPTVSIV